MKSVGLLILSALVSGCVANGQHRSADQHRAGPVFMIRSTDKPPEAVVEAVKSYAEARKWPFLGADEVKQGQVTLVKFCIPEVAQQIWSAGLQVSAMLPCGNLGVYRRDGRTEISLLHPDYMTRLYPDPAVQRASAIAEPVLTEMLDSIAR